MTTNRQAAIAAVAVVVVLCLAARGGAQQAPGAPAAAPTGPLPPAVMLRSVPMKDARAALAMKERLDGMKAGGVFREVIAGPVPNQVISKELQFVVAGNELEVIGEPDKVLRNIDVIRMLCYLGERPRAHLQMNLRVVQITGPANAEVTQLSEAVQALVQTQRDEVVRTFSDLAEYLARRLRDPLAPTAELVKSTHALLPALGSPERSPTIPETLLLLMLDRLATRLKPANASGTATSASTPVDEAQETTEDLLRLPKTLAEALADPHQEPDEIIDTVKPDLQRWLQRVNELQQKFAGFAAQLDKAKNPASVDQLKESLRLPTGGVPDWIAIRLIRSLEVTERAFPSLTREHAIKTVQEFQRRFEIAGKRGQQLLSDLEQAGSAHRSARADDRDRPAGKITETLLALKALASRLAPPPMAIFDQVAAVVDAVSPSPEQVLALFRDYSTERAKLDALQAGTPNAGPVNYAKLQSLETTLNLWLRRSAEALGRSLEGQFYSQYTNELRLLANKTLGRSSDRDLLSQSQISSVPDVARDQLLAGSSVNIFLSNSISLQFAPDTTNSVSAQIQSSLPSQRSLAERLQATNDAQQKLNALNQAVPGLQIDAAKVLGSLLAGGEAVPVRGGINFTATPSIGYDAGTVNLVLSTSQTLEPVGERVTDRVANHSISNATITALSYEPMVLSTLASNMSFYEQVGGIPVLRKAPIIKELVNDIPVKPIGTTKRQRGVVQASVVILEPIVIPTIEDLVRYESGYRTGADGT